MLSFPSRKKKSKKLFIAATALAAVVFAGSYFIISNSSTGEVVAKINGQKIFRSEIEMKLSEVFEGQDASNIPAIDNLPKEIVEILVKEVYLERELTKEAAKSEIGKSTEVQNKITEAKNRILRQSYIDSILKKDINDQKVNDKYLDLSKELEGKKEYQIFHIVVKTKEEADKIVQDLRGKKSSKFADFAKKYSIDQDTAEKGGEIDYTLEDSMIKEIASVVTTLEKDQISDPVETKYGWHIIKLGDTRPAKALSFEAVKDNIRDQLIQDKINEINKRIIKEAKVQILIQLKEIEKSQKQNTNIPADTVPATTKEDKPSEEVKAETEVKASEEKKEETSQAVENKDKSHANHKNHKKSKN